MRVSVLFFLAFFIFVQADAAVVRIGNGDDGSDLEGAEELTQGVIVTSRTDAVKLLKSLNVNAVRGLGALIPEVESTKLYLAKKDSSNSESGTVVQGSFHLDMKGRVYARTFAEPHAATRFFPVATRLENDQLMALQIHEGLHRSLPPAIRENEAIVSEITLAITSPDSSFDRIQKVVNQYIPEEKESEVASPPASPIPETAKIKNPSEFSIGYRSFFTPASDTTYPISSIEELNTELYPFGSSNALVSGVGFELSLINRSTGSLMGPLKLNIESKMWSLRGFDVGFWGTGELNTLSATELKSSPYGRDTWHVGLSIRKDLPFFSIENILGYTFSGQSLQTVGAVQYTYHYGGVVEVSTHPAFLISHFRVGGFLELLLGDSYEVTSAGGAFDYNPGRFRLLSGGPEVEFRFNSIALTLTGRFLLNATQDASYDSLGDLLGFGVAQGYLGLKFSYFF